MADSAILQNAIGIALGGGSVGVGLQFMKWLISWFSGRTDSRQTRLDEQWRDLRIELMAENRDLKSRLEMVESHFRSMTMAVHHLYGALVRIDPENSALKLAEQVLTVSFPPAFTMPENIQRATQNASEALDKEKS